MKISTKGRYGLRIMLDLALNAGAKPRMIHQIADSQQISEKYISRLIIKLRKAGMVKSIRGAKGGYRIARYPKNLTLLEILEVMEGPVSIVNCVCHPKSCNVTEECAAREIWCNLNEEGETRRKRVFRLLHLTPPIFHACGSSVLSPPGHPRGSFPRRRQYSGSVRQYSDPNFH